MTAQVGWSGRVAVVGARRVRQGTGEYVAREFARAGCTVQAIVGTSRQTVEAARGELRARYGIECGGYLSLPELLDGESVDAVAICSPADAHLPQLQQAVGAGCHVFCEKPLWWTEKTAAVPRAEIEATVGGLLRDCAARRRYLAINTQWPYTLPAFRRLHPRAYGADRPVREFRMWLAPSSTGARMVIDAASHLLSMLYALLGVGSLHDLCTVFDGPEQLCIRLIYRHAGGETAVRFDLRQHPAPPRPAGYAINGHKVERHVEWPSYLLSLAANHQRVPLDDPLTASVRSFIRSAEAGKPLKAGVISAGMLHLQDIVTATQAAEPYE